MSFGRRPIGVWVISAWYVLSMGFSLPKVARTFSGAIKLSPVEEAYFASLSDVEWFLSWASTGLLLSAAVCLFLLRRIAVVLFLGSLVLNVAFSMITVMRTDWSEVLGTDTDEAMGSSFWVLILLGMLFSWVILVAVIAYSRRLAKRGVLT